MSLSLDKDAAAIATFRKDPAHPMPWSHGILDEAEAKELFARLGRGGPMLPSYLLVDGRGRIVSSSPRLRAGTLAEAVERALQK